jgi:hypothetical protein
MSTPFTALLIPNRGICLSFSRPVTPEEADEIFQESPDVFRIEGANGFYERPAK